MVMTIMVMIMINFKVFFFFKIANGWMKNWVTMIFFIRSQVPDSVDRAIAITSVIGQPAVSLGGVHDHYHK